MASVVWEEGSTEFKGISDWEAKRVSRKAAKPQRKKWAPASFVSYQTSCELALLTFFLIS